MPSSSAVSWWWVSEAWAASGVMRGSLRVARAGGVTCGSSRTRLAEDQQGGRQAAHRRLGRVVEEAAPEAEPAARGRDDEEVGVVLAGVVEDLGALAADEGGRGDGTLAPVEPAEEVDEQTRARPRGAGGCSPRRSSGGRACRRSPSGPRGRGTRGRSGGRRRRRGWPSPVACGPWRRSVRRGGRWRRRCRRRAGGAWGR